jgi:nascent polypeptide-associated complex subunit alpha
MFGGDLNPGKMQQMMDQMGIDVSELDATEVVIRTGDTDLVFDAPDVTRMDAKGQETYQIVGTPEEREAGAGSGAGSDAAATEGDESGGIPDDDVSLVAERAGVDEDTARDALERVDGDLAAAIGDLE